MAKKIIKPLLAIICLGTLFTACRYEEGPFLCFSKVSNRIRGQWQIVDVQVNGSPADSLYCSPEEVINSTFEFYKSLVLIVYYRDGATIKTGSGTWDFSDKKKKLVVTFRGKNEIVNRSYEIVKFKSKELKLRYKDNKGDTWVYTFELLQSFVPYGM